MLQLTNCYKDSIRKTGNKEFSIGHYLGVSNRAKKYKMIHDYYEFIWLYGTVCKTVTVKKEQSDIQYAPKKLYEKREQRRSDDEEFKLVYGFPETYGNP